MIGNIIQQIALRIAYLINNLIFLLVEFGGCVYIMANAVNTIVYTGVSSELEYRVWQHKNNYFPKAFTTRYKCYKLVYFNFFPEIEEAIAEEKRIKAGNRTAKEHLINNLNSTWKDLYDDLI